MAQPSAAHAPARGRRERRLRILLPVQLSLRVAALPPDVRKGFTLPGTPTNIIWRLGLRPPAGRRLAKSILDHSHGRPQALRTSNGEAADDSFHSRINRMISAFTLLASRGLRRGFFSITSDSISSRELIRRNRPSLTSSSSIAAHLPA